MQSQEVAHGDDLRALVELEAEQIALVAGHEKIRRTPGTSGRICASTSVAITMGACTPSGPGQHDRDGEHNGAGTLGEVAAGSNDRTSGSASLPAGAARPGKRRCAAPPSHRPPADHSPPAAVNRDASLYRCRARYGAIRAACIRRPCGVRCQRRPTPCNVCRRACLEQSPLQ